MSDNFITIMISREDAKCLDSKYAKNLDDPVEQRIVDAIRKELKED
jgi:hypothetical protein